MDSFKNPAPAVDAIIFHKTFNRIILVKRKNQPYGLALPGGFVNEGESLENAVRREVMEELGVRMMLHEQFLTYSEPDRDPRKHVMSTVFIGSTMEDPVAGDDAADAVFLDFPSKTSPDTGRLVFDHGRIINDVWRYLTYGVRPRFGSLI